MIRSDRAAGERGWKDKDTKQRNNESAKSTASEVERVLIMPRRGVHYFRLSVAKSITKSPNHQLRGPVTPDLGTVHQTRLGGVERITVMHNTAVVPHHDVTTLPGVFPDEFGPGCGRPQQVE